MEFPSTWPWNRLLRHLQLVMTAWVPLLRTYFLGILMIPLLMTCPNDIPRFAETAYLTACLLVNMATCSTVRFLRLGSFLDLACCWEFFR